MKIQDKKFLDETVPAFLKGARNLSFYTDTSPRPVFSIGVESTGALLDKWTSEIYHSFSQDEKGKVSIILCGFPADFMSKLEEFVHLGSVSLAREAPHDRFNEVEQVKKSFFALGIDMPTSFWTVRRKTVQQKQMEKRMKELEASEVSLMIQGAKKRSENLHVKKIPILKRKAGKPDVSQTDIDMLERELDRAEEKELDVSDSGRQGPYAETSAMHFDIDDDADNLIGATSDDIIVHEGQSKENQEPNNQATDDVFLCLFCTEIFIGPTPWSQIRAHLGTERHSNLPMFVKRMDEDGVEKLYNRSCQTCSGIFKKPEFLKEHLDEKPECRRRGSLAELIQKARGCPPGTSKSKNRPTSSKPNPAQTFTPPPSYSPPPPSYSPPPPSYSPPPPSISPYPTSESPYPPIASTSSQRRKKPSKDFSVADLFNSDERKLRSVKKVDYAKLEKGQKVASSESDSDDIPDDISIPEDMLLEDEPNFEPGPFETVPSPQIVTRRGSPHKNEPIPDPEVLSEPIRTQNLPLRCLFCTFQTSSQNPWVDLTAHANIHVVKGSSNSLTVEMIKKLYMRSCQTCVKMFTNAEMQVTHFKTSPCLKESYLYPDSKGAPVGYVIPLGAVPPPLIPNLLSKAPDKQPKQATQPKQVKKPKIVKSESLLIPKSKVFRATPATQSKPKGGNDGSRNLQTPPPLDHDYLNEGDFQPICKLPDDPWSGTDFPTVPVKTNDDLSAAMDFYGLLPAQVRLERAQEIPEDEDFPDIDEVEFLMEGEEYVESDVKTEKARPDSPTTILDEIVDEIVAEDVQSVAKDAIDEERREDDEAFRNAIVVRKCVCCPQDFPDNSLEVVQGHLNTEHKYEIGLEGVNELYSRSCQECRLIFNRQVHLKRHLRKSHCHAQSLAATTDVRVKSEIRTPMTRATTTIPTVPCLICETTFSTLTPWLPIQEHMKQDHPDRYEAWDFKDIDNIITTYNQICFGCGKVFHTFEAYEHHTKANKTLDGKPQGRCRNPASTSREVKCIGCNDILDLDDMITHRKNLCPVLAQPDNEEMDTTPIAFLTNLSTVYPCLYCDETFDSYSPWKDIGSHMYYKHKPEYRQIIQPNAKARLAFKDAKNVLQAYARSCLACKQIFRNQKDLEQHISKFMRGEGCNEFDHRWKMLKCECTYQCTTIDDMLSHCSLVCPLEAEMGDDDDWIPNQKSRATPRFLNDSFGSEEWVLCEFPCKFCSMTFRKDNPWLYMKAHMLKEHSSIEAVKSLNTAQDVMNLYGTECKPCNKVFRSTKMYLRHTTTASCVAKTSIVCSECGTICRDERNFMTHMRKIHTPTCRIRDCKLTFENMDQMKLHLINDHRFREECDICGSMVLNEIRLSLHKKIHHSIKPKCGRCGEDFNGVARLKRHIQNNCEIPKVPCRLCSEIFPTLKTRKEHEDVVHGGFDYEKFYDFGKGRFLDYEKGVKVNIPCPFCPKLFPNRDGVRSWIKAHFLNHHKGKVDAEKLKELKNVHLYFDRTCKMCNKTFASFVQLHMHKQSKSRECRNELPICGRCGEVCENFLALSKHMHYYHSEPKACRFCGKLIRRIRIKRHEGACEMAPADPVNCPHCNKQIKKKINLSWHIKKYHSTKTTPCSVCGKAFGSSSDLKIHRRNTHKIDLLQCRLCEEKFVYHQDRLNHEKDFHGRALTDLEPLRRMERKKELMLKRRAQAEAEALARAQNPEPEPPTRGGKWRPKRQGSTPRSSPRKRRKQELGDLVDAANVVTEDYSTINHEELNQAISSIASFNASTGFH